MERFAAVFSEVPDPRAANVRHDLVEVLLMALMAMLCGAEDCTEMALFARSKAALLRQVAGLRNGTPSHDTFSRVFRLLAPEPFEAALGKFSTALAGSLEGVVAIDGKALRRAYERGRKNTPLHLVNVWAAQARLVIGQKLAPGRNEVLGAQQALALLDLKGCIVTADALHCRADTARIIRASGAHYALALKNNQPSLLAQAKILTAAADPASAVHDPLSFAHDRHEQRSALVVPASGLEFPDLAAIGMVRCTRQPAGAEPARSTRWYLLSSLLSAERLLQVARTHWTIENQLHWVLDVTLAEDAARSRKDNAPHNLATLRKLALNTLTSHPQKGSIKGKIKRAAWEENFLISLISHMR